MSDDADHVVWMVAFLLAFGSYKLGVYVEKSRSVSYEKMTISDQQCEAMFEERLSKVVSDMDGKLMSEIFAFEFADKRPIGPDLNDLCIRVFDETEVDREFYTGRN